MTLTKETQYIVNDGELILTEEEALELRDMLIEMLMRTGK